MKPHQLAFCITIASAMLGANSALACAPTPTCWIEEGPGMKQICRNAAKYSAGVFQHLDEPDQVPRFVKACAKLGITVKPPRKIK
jgi:hypothetical protein